MALRAIPNLWYVRPATRTRRRWPGGSRSSATAARSRSRSRGRSCRRSTAPRSRRPRARARRLHALAVAATARPDLLLLATGSEVGLALDAAPTLDADVRVVSMPCWELFAEQPQEYRDDVLPPDVAARLAVEAGITLGWERWVGEAAPRSASTASARRRPATRCWEPRLHARERRDRAPAPCSSGSRMRVAVAFDHRGVKLRERGPRGSSPPRPRGGRPRHRHRRRADRLPGQGARGRRGDPRRRRRARASSSAAPASAPRSPPARSPGSAPRSATTSTRPTRASSTTT